jgi:hypothetical protein
VNSLKVQVHIWPSFSCITMTEGKQQPILRISAPNPGDPSVLGIIDKFFSKTDFVAETIKTRFEQGGPQMVEEAEWRDL